MHASVRGHPPNFVHGETVYICTLHLQYTSGPRTWDEGGKGQVTHKVAGLAWLLLRQLCNYSKVTYSMPSWTGRSLPEQEGTRASRRSADGPAKTLRPSWVVMGFGGLAKAQGLVSPWSRGWLRCLGARTVDWDA